MVPSVQCLRLEFPTQNPFVDITVPVSVSVSEHHKVHDAFLTCGWITTGNSHIPEKKTFKINSNPTKKILMPPDL